MISRSPVALLAVCLLLLTALTPVATAAQTSDDGDVCQTEVTHDAFKTDNATIEQLQNQSEARSQVDNTAVTISEGSGFYRVDANNPNGYCVLFTVRVSEGAMPPAKIPGTVESTNGEHEASWEAIHDFNTSNTYTEITFTLPANTTATFAPSEVRVVSLSWASERAEKADSVADRLKERFDDDDLTQRQYRINPDQKQEVVVPLRNPKTDEQIEDWQAMYSVDGGETWQPVQRESTDPVYISEEGNDRVTFRFNDPKAEVRYTAEPTIRDEFRYQTDSYLSGVPNPFSDDGSGLFGAVIPRTVIA